MTKEQIRDAYRIAENKAESLTDAVNIGFQMALNKEVLLDDYGRILRID